MKTEDIRKFEQERLAQKHQLALQQQLVAVELTEMGPHLAPEDQQVLNEIIEMVKKHSFVAQAMPKSMVRVEKFLLMAILEQQKELRRLRDEINQLPFA